MLDEKIINIRKSVAKWEYRILAAFGVNPCKCPKCNDIMRFNDIVYSRYGSVREYLGKRIVEENEAKLEKVLELYAITKGLVYGRINPKTM
jgi:hypothetical protein